MQDDDELILANSIVVAEEQRQSGNVAIYIRV